MLDAFSRVRRFAAGAGIVFALAGCGNSITSPTPSAGDTSNAEIPLGTLSIDRSKTQGVSALFTSVSAHASPALGRRIQGLRAPVAITPQRASASHPEDLTYYGGKVLHWARSINIYVNEPASTWGAPAVFERRLGASKMIHLVDQYMRPRLHMQDDDRYEDGDRYSYAGSFRVSGYDTHQTCAAGSAGSDQYGQPLPNAAIPDCLLDSDIQHIVYDAARALGKSDPGYQYIFHVFLGPDVNHCSAAAGGCYSPASPGNFTACAYHGSATIAGIGYALFTLDPYENTPGCQVNGPSPNGPLIDSTASQLSHETFETITDPDADLATAYAAPLAWYNITYGEIGDECAPAAGVTSGLVSLDGHTYGIQPEYSNASHSCSFSR